MDSKTHSRQEFTRVHKNIFALYIQIRVHTPELNVKARINNKITNYALLTKMQIKQQRNKI